MSIKKLRRAVGSRYVDVIAASREIAIEVCRRTVPKTGRPASTLIAMIDDRDPAKVSTRLVARFAMSAAAKEIPELAQHIEHKDPDDVLRVITFDPATGEMRSDIIPLR